MTRRSERPFCSSSMGAGRCITPFFVKEGPLKNSDSFKLKDKVVYPGHGVGEITAIISKSVAGTEQRFFEILVADTGMRIMVPVEQATVVGLRRVIDKRSLDKVYVILKTKTGKIDTQTWNRRFREYSQKIKSGSVFEIAEVLRDLTVLSVGKELSFGEKKMLDTARGLLASEISVARARPMDKVLGELQEMCG